MSQQLIEQNKYQIIGLHYLHRMYFENYSREMTLD